MYHVMPLRLNALQYCTTSSRISFTTQKLTGTTLVAKGSVHGRKLTLYDIPSYVNHLAPFSGVEGANLLSRRYLRSNPYRHQVIVKISSTVQVAKDTSRLSGGQHGHIQLSGDSPGDRTECLQESLKLITTSSFLLQILL